MRDDMRDEMDHGDDQHDGDERDGREEESETEMSEEESLERFVTPGDGVFLLGPDEDLPPKAKIPGPDDEGFGDGDEGDGPEIRLGELAQDEEDDGDDGKGKKDEEAFSALNAAAVRAACRLGIDASPFEIPQ